MTVPIQPGSPRAPHARRFARELQKAMTTRDVGRVRLAMAMGLKSHSIIAAWRSGVTLPRTDSARALAEVLEWPRLLQIVLVARTQKCARPSCDKTFVNDGGGPKAYCSPRCRGIMETSEGVSSGRRERDTLFREREELRAAVRTFCMSCEPGGACQDPDCALRHVSPLPLIEAPSRALATATPYDREAGLQAARAGSAVALQERWNGEHAEANRRRQSEQTRDRWAAMTTEERAETGRRIGAGRRQVVDA